MIAEKTNEQMEQVLEVAQRDLEQIQERLKEFDRLNRERERLETLINFAKSFLGKDGQAEKRIGESAEKPVGLGLDIPLIEKPILQGAIDIIREAGRAMTLKEIEAGFRQRHWKLSEQNGREVLRVTLRGKPEINLIRIKRNNKSLIGYKLREHIN